MREDQNEESIKHALAPSKTQRDRRQAKGATVGEEKGSELSKAMPASKAKAKPSQPAKGDGKGKGKGDQASKGPPPVSKAQPNVAKAKASADPKGKPSVPCFFFQRLKGQSHSPSFTCPPTSPWGFSAQLFSWRFSFLILALLWGFMAIYAALRSVESCPDGEQHSCWALLLVQRIKFKNGHSGLWGGGLCEISEI